MTNTLSLTSLSGLDALVRQPAYQRTELTPGILHIGIGNFHRAHQAVYLDDLFNAGLDHDWALIGAGVRAEDTAMRTDLAGQDWLCTVVELEPGANRARVTGAMIDFVPIQPDNKALVEAMADATSRIVSLTVTEGGYYIDPVTGGFALNHPAIRADAANPSAPQTVFGAIVSALRLRREGGLKPFTVMSCDNLPHNGDVARAAVTGLARLSDPDLADWIDGEVTFPHSMVDRITPATTPARRQHLLDAFGIDDARPVFCEPFRQWVMQDRFCAGRPALDRVGVTFTNDVAGFEFMKLRILNGGHAIIAYPAALLELTFAHEAMAHPLVSGFLAKIEREEILPAIPALPGVDREAYLAMVERRFANPEIGDTIARLCADGANRQPKFILPSTRDRLAAGLPIPGLALVSALWCRYLRGTSDSGRSIKIEEVDTPRMQAAAERSRANPDAFLDLGDVFGGLEEVPAFRTAFAAALSELDQRGTAGTLERYLAAS